LFPWMRPADRSVYRLAPEPFDTIRAPISMVQKTHFRAQTSGVVRVVFHFGTCRLFKVGGLSYLNDFLRYRKVFAVPRLAHLSLRTAFRYLSDTVCAGDVSLKPRLQADRALDAQQLL
jgi:hypothetical protein